MDCGGHKIITTFTVFTNKNLAIYWICPKTMSYAINYVRFLCNDPSFIFHYFNDFMLLEYNINSCAYSMKSITIKENKLTNLLGECLLNSSPDRKNETTQNIHFL